MGKDQEKHGQSGLHEWHSNSAAEAVGNISPHPRSSADLVEHADFLVNRD